MTEEKFYLPPEWAPHEAVWLAWPHQRADWPGKFAAIPWVFAEMVRRLVPGELVRLIVLDAKHEAAARRVLEYVLGPAGRWGARVQFFRIPTDRGWTRDMGPIFLRRGGPRGPRVVADFRFNGWAKYDNHRLDDRVARTAAKKLGFEVVRPVAAGRPVVLEGGAIDVNGAGTLLTTRQCMLDHSQQPRNPQLSQQQLEQVFADYLGATHVFYFDEGIAGDDTGGHIDDLCRFVSPNTVALVTCDNPSDENYRPLRRCREQAAELRLADGSRPEVIYLPSPEPLCFRGQRLPASYANFFIGNEVVLVPTFNDPADRKALGLLSEVFSDRRVIGIHAVDLVWGLGTIHCLTQQQPAA